MWFKKTAHVDELRQRYGMPNLPPEKATLSAARIITRNDKEKAEKLVSQTASTHVVVHASLVFAGWLEKGRCPKKVNRHTAKTISDNLIQT